MYDDSNSGFFYGFIFALICVWGYGKFKQENIIVNVESQIENSFALEKLGSGQVAAFHGFVDDYSACNTAAKALEAQGGMYFCVSSSTVSKIDTH